MRKAHAEPFDKIKADITALQEKRWLGQGCYKLRNYDIYYSGLDHGIRKYGCGFVVGRRLRHLVSRFTPVSERIVTIRIKARFFYISLICVYAPHEGKDDGEKDDLKG